MYLVLSDLHGRFNEVTHILDEVHKKYPLKTFKRIIFLGDYIAYGPDSLKTLRFLKAFQQKYKNSVFIKGNWEEMLLTLHYSKDKDAKKQTIQIIQNKKQEKTFQEIAAAEDKDEILKFINSMKDYHVETHYIFTHSGVDFDEYDPKKHINDFLREQDAFHLRWNDVFFEDAKHFAMFDAEKQKQMPYYIVFGHTPIPYMQNKNKILPLHTPYVQNNIIGVDFGASSRFGKFGAVIIDPDGIKTKTVAVGNVPTKTEKEKEKTKIQKNKDSKLETLKMHRKRYTNEEIASIRGLAVSTVEKHLIQCFELGKKIRFEELIDEKREETVLKLLKRYGVDFREILNEYPDTDHSEIKAVASKHGIARFFYESDQDGE